MTAGTMRDHARALGEPIIRVAVMVTVALSIFVHGLNATPGISLYASKVSALETAAPG